MYKYRISKYNPQYRDEYGVYKKSEWTSYCDIGKIYDGKKFKVDDYIKSEQKYCDTILNILKSIGANEVIVKDLELNYMNDEIEDMLELRGLILSLEDKTIINSIRNNDKIKVNELRPYLKLILREGFWCKLIDAYTLVQVEFGYDFYVYIHCKSISDAIINDYAKQGMYIEKIYS